MKTYELRASFDACRGGNKSKIRSFEQDMCINQGIGGIGPCSFVIEPLIAPVFLKILGLLSS